MKLSMAGAGSKRISRAMLKSIHGFSEFTYTITYSQGVVSDIELRSSNTYVLAWVVVTRQQGCGRLNFVSLP